MPNCSPVNIIGQDTACSDDLGSCGGSDSQEEQDLLGKGTLEVNGLTADDSSPT